MPTISTDIYPATEGQDLGRPNQAWDLYVRSLTVVPGGTVNGTIFPTGNGNATAIQARPVAATAPTVNQELIWNGTSWVPGSGDAVSLNGILVTGVPVTNQVLGYDGVHWVPVNQTGGGGGGATLGFVTTSFSATPTFTPSPTGSCTFKITLTGDVTSSTLGFGGVTAGCIFTFLIIQDGTGGRAFTWPTNVFGAIQVGTDANQVTTQEFVWDGTNLYATAIGAIYP